VEEILRTMLSGGPFGLLAGVFWYMYRSEKDEFKAYREKTESTLQQLYTSTHAEHARLRADYDRDEDRMRELHAAELREHREQMSDLRNAHAAREQQSMATVEYFAKAAVEAVEELGKIAEALRRAYDSSRRR